MHNASSCRNSLIINIADNVEKHTVVDNKYIINDKNSGNA